MTLQQLRQISFALSRDHLLGNFIHEMASVRGAKVAATEDGSESMSYQDLAGRVDHFAAAMLALGSVRRGDRVVVATPNGVDQFLLCVAASRIGAIAVPVNSQMRSGEIELVVADAQPRMVVRDPSELLDGQPPEPGEITPCEAASSDIAALFYTSGTTGTPKGVALSHRSLVGQTHLAALWPASFRDDEVMMSLPIAHIMGFVSLVGLLTAGIAAYVVPKFTATRILDVIESRHAGGFIGVPAMYRKLYEAGAESRDLHSIRVWMSGADVMPSDLARQFKRMGASAVVPVLGAVGEATFVEAYGMVEIGGGAATKISPAGLALPIVQDIGFKLPGYQFRAVDDHGQRVRFGRIGELQLKGPGVLQEYWNAPEATATALTEDGWLRTGDLVRLGPFGTMVFCGRLKHVIKSGGFSVYPLEVEAILDQHPDVAEACVVAIGDPVLGEVPAAALRLHEGSSLDETSIQLFLEERLSRFKQPRRFVQIEEFPRTGTQKIDKARVAALFDRHG